MSAQTNRTVTLTLDTQTTGTDGIVNLAKELQKLGKQGGDAAPEFERLSAELNEIANQQDAVNSMKALTDEVQKSVGVMNSAKEAVAKEEAALSTLSATLRAAKASEEAHAASVRAAVASRQQANQQYLEARAKISEYVASIGGAKRANDEQKVTLRELNQALRESKAAFDNSKAAVAALTPEYDKLKSASAGIAAEVKQQEGALRAVTKVADSAKESYSDLTTALADTSQQASRLGVDTTDLVGEQNRLKQSTLQLTQEADKLKASLAATGAAARTSAQQLEQAFNVVGVRSTGSIKSEILKLNQALGVLARSTSVTGAEFDSAFAKGRARIAELEVEMKRAEGAAKSFGGGFTDAFRSFGPATLVFNGVTAAIGAFTRTASEIPRVTAQFQSMSRTLTVLTGSTTEAAKEFEYIKTVADRVGTGIIDLGKGYAKLVAATKDTNLAGAQTKRIFEAVSGAMGVLGASSDETAGALQAVTQMVSKGTVSMEEMRQQLSERLPGAFQATAKEMGLTVSELTDLISSGKLAADDMLPALARGLEDMYKSGAPNTTLIGQWNQFTNAIKNSLNAIGDTGAVEQLLKWGRVVSAVVIAAGEQFVGLGKAIGIAAASITDWSLDKGWADIKQHFSDINQRMFQTSGLAKGAGDSLGEMAAAARAAGKDYVVLASGQKLSVAAIEASNKGFVAFSVATEKAQKSAEGFATSARKTAEYTRAAGEASITAANALGTETDKRETATKVAEKNTAALGALVVAEQKILTLMEEEALKRAEAIRDGLTTSDAHKKQLADLGEEIAKREATVTGLTQQAEAQRILAEALKIEAETVKDNSGRLEELRIVNVEFANALTLVRAAVEAGTITQQQANVVEEEARKVKALYSDALKDQIEKTEALKDQKVAQLNLDASGLNLAIALQKSIQQTARLRGDEYGVLTAGNNIKRLEIQLMEITAKVKAAEARAIIEATRAKREELRLAGELSEAKEAELQATELGAQAKIKESEIITETVKQMKELADVTELGGGAAGSAAGGYDSLAASIGNAADAAGRLNAAQNGGNGGTKGDVVYDKYGKPVTSGTSLLDQGHSTDKQVDVEAQLYKRDPKASVEEVKAAAKYYGELYMRESATRLTGNLGSADNAARLTNQAANTAMDGALRLARQELQTGQAIDLGVSVNDLMKKNISIASGMSNIDTQAGAIKRAGAEAKNQPTEKLATVNMYLNGNRTQITATQEDAKALGNLFKIIESDASRAF